MAQPNRTREELKEKTTRIVRWVGYVVFMGGGLLIFIPMLLAVGSGISSGDIWDPFTGQTVNGDQPAIDCQGEARRLMIDAGHRQSLSASWNEPYSTWLIKCKDDHPHLHDMLRATRQEIRRQ